MNAATNIAAAWRRYDGDETRLTAQVGERMLDLASLHAGARVLDIATGRGEPALRAAARVAPGGFVVGTDLSRDMLDVARAKAAARRVANLALVVTDGQTLASVPDATFDAALCRWGFMFFASPLAGLTAARRCLRRDGVLVAAVWAAPTAVPWWSMPREVLARHVPLPPVDPAAPGPCRLASPEAFRADLAEAGFVVEHEETLDVALVESATPDGLLDWCVAFGLPPQLAGQPPRVRDAWAQDLRSEARRRRDADGMYRLGGTTRLVAARAG